MSSATVECLASNQPGKLAPHLPFSTHVVGILVPASPSKRYHPSVRSLSHKSVVPVYLSFLSVLFKLVYFRHTSSKTIKFYYQQAKLLEICLQQILIWQDLLMEQVKENHCYRNKTVVGADKTKIVLVAGEVSWMVL